MQPIQDKCEPCFEVSCAFPQKSWNECCMAYGKPNPLGQQLKQARENVVNGKPMFIQDGSAVEAGCKFDLEARLPIRMISETALRRDAGDLRRISKVESLALVSRSSTGRKAMTSTTGCFQHHFQTNLMLASVLAWAWINIEALALRKVWSTKSKRTMFGRLRLIRCSRTWNPPSHHC